MEKTKNFSFSDFVSFSESLVDSLDAVATKIEEVTNQITTLETVLEGGDNPSEETTVSAENNIESTDTAPTIEEGTVDSTVTEEVTAPVEDNTETVSVDESVTEENNNDVTEELPTEEENDAAAIDAMSTDGENFSEKFIVVGLKNRPWGNKVISAKEFSEQEHRKLIPTTFSTKAQAQRALTSYNVNGGENFSIKVQHNSNIVNMSETTPQSRYNTVKGIFNM